MARTRPLVPRSTGGDLAGRGTFQPTPHGGRVCLSAAACSALPGRHKPLADARATPAGLLPPPALSAVCAPCQPHEPAARRRDGGTSTVNCVNIVARLTRDPESRTTGDRSVCGMRVAIDRSRSDGADFVDVTAFGKLADVCLEYLEKGRQIALEGRLHYSEWETDGERRARHEVIAQQ